MKGGIVMRLVLFGVSVLCVAAIASCAIGIDRVFTPELADRDARAIYQGMKSVPLRPGDAPVDFQPE